MSLFLWIISVSMICSIVNGQSAGCNGSNCQGVSYSECEKYTRYTLALQNWCNNGNWSIHGLWPDYSTTCYPQYCHSPTWEDVSDSLETEMLQVWNWCENSMNTQQTDWEHEWMRHGIYIYIYIHI